MDNKRTLTWVVVAVLITVGAVGGYFLFKDGNREIETIAWYESQVKSSEEAKLSARVEGNTYKIDGSKSYSKVGNTKMFRVVGLGNVVDYISLDNGKTWTREVRDYVTESKNLFIANRSPDVAKYLVTDNYVKEEKNDKHIYRSKENAYPTESVVITITKRSLTVSVNKSTFLKIERSGYKVSLPKIAGFLNVRGESIEYLETGIFKELNLKEEDYGQDEWVQIITAINNAKTQITAMTKADKIYTVIDQLETFIATVEKTPLQK